MARQPGRGEGQSAAGHALFVVGLGFEVVVGPRLAARAKPVVAHGTRRRGLTAGTGTIYGMSQKTTVYLPEDLKAAVEREARRRGLSEAEVIRQAIAQAVSRPRPQPGIIDGVAIADRADELLVGFGDR
ncbi:MAG: hypothetical protein QOK43_1747 [Acidimicrobiaceae bacterium]|nr:hypothetical protein [Acidimicrobiaceae bacterium]